MSKNQRRSPRQARSRATWEAIVEAAAQILERGGPEALTTNLVAERAGVSIGTLYQYFSDKRSLLLAAARRDLAANAAPLPKRQRALVQALIAMLEHIGRLGGGAPVAPSGERVLARVAPSPRRRPANSSNQTFDVIQDWLMTLLPLPEPTLRPIPIRRIRE